jgi:protein AroM
MKALDLLPLAAPIHLRNSQGRADMKSKRLGIVVIGQSPRPDVEAEMRGFLGDDVEIELRGALDGLTRGEIDAIKPKNDADTLFSRLPPNGEDVKISKQVVEDHARTAIERFVREGTTVTMLCCTGKFHGLDGRGMVVQPSAVLSGLVDGLLPKGRLGILVPLSEQTGELAAKWGRRGLDVVGVPLVPSAEGAAIDEAARALDALHPDLVVMDCMSYNKAMKDRVRQTLRAPVILAVAAAARVVGELLS